MILAYIYCNYYYLQQHWFQQGDVCTAGDGLSVISPLRVDDRHAQSVFHRLTLLHARCDGNEGHEGTESQVDPQQGLVEVAGDGVCVVLVHEGEGHGGDGVEEEGGAHHRQIPTLVLCCSSQPDRGGRGQRKWLQHRYSFQSGCCMCQRNPPEVLE